METLLGLPAVMMHFSYLRGSGWHSDCFLSSPPLPLFCLEPCCITVDLLFVSFFPPLQRPYQKIPGH